MTRESPLTKAITRPTLELRESLGLRTYIPEPRRTHRSRWIDKSAEEQQAVLVNRRRIKRDKSKRLQRRRSELCERTFAHVCNRDGMRRSRVKGVTKLAKHYLIAVAACNLGRYKLLGIGKPKRCKAKAALER
jgi:transposase